MEKFEGFALANRGRSELLFDQQRTLKSEHFFDRVDHVRHGAEARSGGARDTQAKDMAKIEEMYQG